MNDSDGEFDDDSPRQSASSTFGVGHSTDRDDEFEFDDADFDASGGGGGPGSSGRGLVRRVARGAKIVSNQHFDEAVSVSDGASDVSSVPSPEPRDLGDSGYLDQSGDLGRVVGHGDDEDEDAVSSSAFGAHRHHHHHRRPNDEDDEDGAGDDDSSSDSERRRRMYGDSPPPHTEVSGEDLSTGDYDDHAMVVGGPSPKSGTGSNSTGAGSQNGGGSAGSSAAASSANSGAGGAGGRMGSSKPDGPVVLGSIPGNIAATAAGAGPGTAPGARTNDADLGMGGSGGGGESGSSPTSSTGGGGGAAGAGLYDPAEYENLAVSNDIRELFHFITEYRPRDVDPDVKFKPHIPDYVPAVGDIDAFIKIPRPDHKTDTLGLTVLDEPSSKQSDPTVLELHLRAISKVSTKQPAIVRSIENAEKNPKAIAQWISSISDLHKSKPPPSVTYSKNMPDIEQLMQEWPSEFEDLLSEVNVDWAELDVDLKSFVKIICSLLDIPVYNNVVESLHVLFTLYSEFKANQHFHQDA